jgi:hypothetical protein
MYCVPRSVYGSSQCRRRVPQSLYLHGTRFIFLFYHIPVLILSSIVWWYDHNPFVMLFYHTHTSGG